MLPLCTLGTLKLLTLLQHQQYHRQTDLTKTRTEGQHSARLPNQLLEKLKASCTLERP